MKLLAILLFTSLGMFRFAVESPMPQLDLVKLATLENASGYITDMTQDGRYIVISNEGGMKLLDVYSGEVKYIADAGEGLRLHPNGTHFIVFDNDLHDNEQNESRLIETESGRVIYETTANFNVFDSGGYTIVTNHSFETLSILIDTHTGEELLFIEDFEHAVSFDGRLLATLNLYISPHEISIIEIATGEILHRIVAPKIMPESVASFSVSTRFTQDNEDLMIYYTYAGTQVVDVETGEVRFSVSGYVDLTADSQNLRSVNEYYGTGQLIDMETVECFMKSKMVLYM